ncbi:unnamed protein product, partial [Rotaria sp. Silwood1]
ANKVPQVLPYTRCRLKQLRFERVKDYLLLEEEFIRNLELKTYTHYFLRKYTFITATIGSTSSPNTPITACT